MRLYEFISETPIPAADPNDLAQIHGPDAQTIGHGQEAQVIKNKSNPNVFKITGIESNLKNFGYMQYVLLSKKYSGVNPYFPKVLSIKQTPQGLPGRVAYIVQLEQLEDSGKLKSSEQLELANKIFYGEDLDDIIAARKKGNSLIQYKIEKAVHAGPAIAAKFVKDKQFIQAIKLVHLVKKNTGATIDMHDANYMIRRGDQGLQIVLTDPIAN
jgi:hypothetical protein